MSIFGNCQKNDVIAITYGDNPDERIVRVIEKRDMILHPAKGQRDLSKGRFLVTCRDGRGEIRSFYSGVAKNVRNVNIIQRVMYSGNGMLPAPV